MQRRRRPGGPSRPRSRLPPAARVQLPGVGKKDPLSCGDPAQWTPSSGSPLIRKMLTSDSFKRGSSEARTKLAIEGMTCASCVATVEGQLMTMGGVQEVSVSLMEKKGIVVHDAKLVSPLVLVDAVRSVGFECELLVEGEGGEGGSGPRHRELHPGDAAVAARVFRLALLHAPHVCARNGAPPAPPTRMPAAQTLDQQHGPQPRPRPLPIDTPRVCPPHRQIVEQVLPHTWLGKSLEVDLVAGLPCRVLMLWVLVTPVQFGFGARFYRRAYRSLRHGGANMDVLVAMGTSAAYFYSVVFTVRRYSTCVPIRPSRHDAPAWAHKFSHPMPICGQVLATATEGKEGRDQACFETSAMLITFILLGKRLETSAKAKASESISNLLTPAKHGAALRGLLGQG